jgi:hypothetical protein
MLRTDPIGRGLLTPFQRDGKGDFANGEGLDLLKSDVGQLLGLEGSSATQSGELPWDPQRGTRLRSLKHRHIHSEMTRAEAELLCTGLLRQFEPRVRPGRVKTQTQNENTLIIEVSYKPLGYRRGENQTISTEV